MFPNCIESLGDQKRATKQQQNKQRKTKETLNK